MPVHSHYHQQGICRAEWIGDVTIEEVIDAMQQLRSILNEKGDQEAVMIVDLTTVKKIPFDIGNLRRVADSDNRISSYVIVNPPLAAQIILNMLKKLSIRTFHHAQTLEEGLAISRELMQPSATIG